jgi:phosphohistidine swiveling domain-containing protein
MGMGRYVLSLNTRSALQETRAGGKGASLARLRRAGFQVPPGFVITAPAFEVFLAYHNLDSLQQGKTWSQGDSEQNQALLLSLPIPPRLSNPILRAYRKLGGPVAVRSSMIGEDSAVASCAGQLDTVLNVDSEPQVLEAVKRCWASLFNWRLLAYLDERLPQSSGPMAEELAIAVVLQRMVEAKAAGVAFSADPVTGQPGVIIEAVRGLGDALMVGRAEPDRYRVDVRGNLVENRPVAQGSPILPDDEVLQLAEIARGVAAANPHPQDIEWAWDGAAFHVLQSRPITTLVGLRIYSNSMVSEMLPGLIKPLVWSVYVAAKAEKVLGRVFTELIGPSEFDFLQLIKRIHSRVYTDRTMLDQILGRMGMPANSFEMMRQGDRAGRWRPPLTPGTARAGLRLLGFAWRQSRIAGEIEDYLQRHEQELASFRDADWRSETPQALLHRLNHLIALLSETLWYVFIGQLNMTIRGNLLDRLAKRDVTGFATTDLTRGLVGRKGLGPHDELKCLAAEARSMGDGVQRLLLEQEDATIRGALATSDEGERLVESVDRFLARWGFLCTSMTDFTQRPWAEHPEIIWQSIGRAAALRADPVNRDIDAQRARAQEQVRAQMNRFQRTIFDRLLASTVTYMELRDRVSLLLSRESFQMRRLFLALTSHLVARDALVQAEDIFYLTMDEIRLLVKGELESDDSKRLVVARQAEMETDALIELPDTIYGDYVPGHHVEPAAEQGYLVGISGSAGVAHGQARVVNDPADAPAQLTAADILVVPFTDISWTPLFSGIGGIVAETGGQLSHTAIVAREYGLPAVVGVKRAMWAIREGQPIVVDGDNGRVYLGQGTQK